VNGKTVFAWYFAGGSPWLRQRRVSSHDDLEFMSRKWVLGFYGWKHPDAKKPLSRIGLIYLPGRNRRGEAGDLRPPMEL